MEALSTPPPEAMFRLFLRGNFRFPQSHLESSIYIIDYLFKHPEKMTYGQYRASVLSGDQAKIFARSLNIAHRQYGIQTLVNPEPGEKLHKNPTPPTKGLHIWNGSKYQTLDWIGRFISTFPDLGTHPDSFEELIALESPENKKVAKLVDASVKTLVSPEGTALAKQIRENIKSSYLKAIKFEFDAYDRQAEVASAVLSGERNTKAFLKRSIASLFPGQILNWHRWDPYLTQP